MNRFVTECLIFLSVSMMRMTSVLPTIPTSPMIQKIQDMLTIAGIVTLGGPAAPEAPLEIAPVSLPVMLAKTYPIVSKVPWPGRKPSAGTMSTAAGSSPSLSKRTPLFPPKNRLESFVMSTDMFPLRGDRLYRDKSSHFPMNPNEVAGRSDSLLSMKVRCSWPLLLSSIYFMFWVSSPYEPCRQLDIAICLVSVVLYQLPGR